MSQYEHFQQQKTKLNSYSALLHQIVENYPHITDLKPIDSFKQEVKDALNFNVLCIGDFSAGKTTFVNKFLIEEDLLPAKARPTTTRLTEIHHGEKQAIHIITEEGEVQTITEDIKEALEAYVVSGGENVSTTALVRIETPSKALSEGVVIIDSPGLNDPDLGRMKVTLDYLHKADAVLYFLNAQQAWTKSQKDFLEGEILGKDELDKLFFMLNYWDCVEENEREDLLEYIQGEMKKSLNVAHMDTSNPPELIPISAKTGEGIELIQEKIWGYLSLAKEKIVQQKVHKLHTLIKQYMQLADEQVILAQENDEALEFKKEQLKKEIDNYQKDADKYLRKLKSNLAPVIEEFIFKFEEILNQFVYDVEQLKEIINLDSKKPENIIISRYSLIENEATLKINRLNSSLQKNIQIVVEGWQGMLNIPVKPFHMEKNYLSIPHHLSDKKDLAIETGAKATAALGGLGFVASAGTSFATTAGSQGFFGWCATGIFGSSASVSAAALTTFSGGFLLIGGAALAYHLRNRRIEETQNELYELIDDIIHQVSNYRLKQLADTEAQSNQLVEQICQNVDFEAKQIWKEKQEELDILGGNDFVIEEASKFKQQLFELQKQVNAL